MNKKQAWETIKIKRLTESQTIQHMSQDAVLLYVLTGEADVMSDDYSMTFSTGEFFVVPNFSDISLTFNSKGNKIYLLTLRYFEESSEDTISIFKGDSKSKGESLNSTLSQSLQKLLRLYYLKREDATYWEVGALYFQIISKLEQKYQMILAKEKGLLSKETLLSYLEQNYREDLSIDSLSKQFFVSKQTMSRFFKQHFGKSLSKYLQDKRFLQLEKELSETDQPINTLVFELGFKNLNSFNRLFKRHYGMSPLEWRRSHRQNKDLLNENIELEQFDEFQEMVQETVTCIECSAQRYDTLTHQTRFCNVVNPELLLDSSCLVTLIQLKSQKSINSIRFPIDFSILSERLYQTILSSLSECNLPCIFTLSLKDINQSNHYQSFFKKLMRQMGSDIFQRCSFELSFQTENNKEWLSDYYHFYHFIKDELKATSCGIGGISIYDNHELLEHSLDNDSLKQWIDFLSFDALPIIKKQSQYSLRENIVRSSHIDQKVADIQSFVSMIRSHHPKLPLVLTGLNLTADETDAINDHLYHANYYLAYIDKVEKLVDSIALGYYFFDKDNKEFSPDEFSGYSGWVTYSGLPKSIFYADQFRQTLSLKSLAKKGTVRVTADEYDKISVLANNYEVLSDYYSSDRTMDLYDNQNYIFNMQNKSVQLLIRDVPNGVYKASFHILDLENGCGPLVLKKYTSLTQLDATMLHFLEQQYAPRVYQKELIVSSHSINEKLYLKPFEIVFVTYERQYS